MLNENALETAYTEIPRITPTYPAFPSIMGFSINGDGAAVKINITELNAKGMPRTKVRSETARCRR